MDVVACCKATQASATINCARASVRQVAGKLPVPPACTCSDCRMRTDCSRNNRECHATVCANDLADPMEESPGEQLVWGRMGWTK